jgi:hypothetical protein
VVFVTVAALVVFAVVVLGVGFARDEPAVWPGTLPPRYWRGFWAVPFTRVSKWTCGPVQFPVQPT